MTPPLPVARGNKVDGGDGHGGFVGLRVLIVEDEAVLAHELGFLLQSMGFDVSGLASSRAEALALSEQASPDIALVDLRLADGMTGLQLADALEERYGTKVVLVTGHAKALAAGDLLGRFIAGKPLNDTEMMSVMRGVQAALEAAR